MCQASSKILTRGIKLVIALSDFDMMCLGLSLHKSVLSWTFAIQQFKLDVFIISFGDHLLESQLGSDPRVSYVQYGLQTGAAPWFTAT